MPPNAPKSHRRPGWYAIDDGERRFWDGETWGKCWNDPMTAGWYERDGTLRYFDGARWTEHVAPVPVLTAPRIAGAVFLGILGALFVIWLGAQIAPNHIYLPVKSVVKELPSNR